MQSSEGHLVIKVFNPTNDTILLLGRLSSVVDPGGQSHPLLDQTIAPASFVKLILPPLRPQVTPTGPSIGIGVGVVGYRDAPGPYDDHPRYFAVYDASDPLYWDWQGETDVKLTLVYRRGNDQFRRQLAHDYSQCVWIWCCDPLCNHSKCQTSCDIGSRHVHRADCPHIGYRLRGPFDNPGHTGDSCRYGDIL